MKPPKKIVIGAILTAALLAFSTLILPLPIDNNNWTFRGRLALSFALALMYVGSAILFLTSLKAYKAQMRYAFITLSAGILLTALASIQLPISNAFGLGDSIWSRGGLIIIPFLLGGLVSYMGLRGFAKLVGVHTVFTKVSVVIPVATVLGALSAFLPHAASISSEIQLDVSNAIVAWIGLLDLAAALMVLQIKQRIGAHYINAMAWLFAALVGSVVVTIAALHASLFGSEPASILVDILTFILGIIYLRAGYAFTQTEDY